MKPLLSPNSLELSIFTQFLSLLTNQVNNHVPHVCASSEGSGETVRRLRGITCSSEHLLVAYAISTKPIVYKTIRRNYHNYVFMKVSKGAKIRNRYNQVPHLIQDTNGKVTNSQLDTTNESQEVSPFPAGDHKAHMNRRTQRHRKHKTEQKHKRSTKEVQLGTVGKYFTGGL